MQNKYRIDFYQCAVYGIEPEYYPTLAEARKEAAGFLRAILARISGHHWDGSLYRDGYARIVDRMGATEACATIARESGS